MLCKPSLFHSLEMTCRQRLLDQALPGHEAVPQRLLLSRGRGLLQEVPRWQVLQRPKVASPDLLPPRVLHQHPGVELPPLAPRLYLP